LAVAATTRLSPNPDDPVQTVRHFNRFYTRQIGVLQEHLLESRLSLTEVRVLYELAHRQNLTAVELRKELGLDRGYLSRMLQKFERQGWVKTTPSAADRRRIFLLLTSKGKKVFAPLDQRSSEEVSAMLARLPSVQQQKLLGAMCEIEGILDGGTSERAPVAAHRDAATSFSPMTLQPQGLKPEVISKDLLGAGSAALPRQTKDGRAAALNHESATYILRQHRPGDMGWVVQRHGELYWQEYRYDERFEALVAEIVAEFIQNFDPKRERCWIAEKDGERAGAIFLVKKSKTVAKLRLLLVEPWARGLGIGRRLVSECVSFARDAGYKKILLWTQSELNAARHLYEQAGFKRIAQKPHQSWGRKDLVAETWELKL
jgi:DNA-binding MarR family transcriptional regulator/N-acetylglutamate synthase-like GNAT family acetyltransferase